MKVSGKVEKPNGFSEDFISTLSSSQKLGKLEANRLEIQWKKICDQEKRSKQRNRELQRDFERVEQHAAMLAVKTERLKTYKQQYENYINKMYPRWREDLENYKLSQQPSRNGPIGKTYGAPVFHPSSSSRAAVLEPRHISNHHISSSAPFNMGPVNDRSPPESRYPGHLHTSPPQGLHGDFSYPERHSDLSHLRGGDFPQSARYSQQTDSRWKAPSFSDSQGQFDGFGRPYQSQFGSNSREPDNLYQRSPEQYLTSSHRQSYDGHQPPRELPGNFPPDARYLHSERSHGQLQGIRPAAPYEPRTELQRSFLDHGVHRGPYDQRGLGERYYDGRPSGYYGDQRGAGFEPRSMMSDVNGRDDAFVDKEFGSGFPTRPTMANGHAATQDVNHLHPANQPFVPPEKPLETNIPTSTSFPEPSLSSTVLESSVEGNSVRRDDRQEGVSVAPSTSQSTPPKALVKDREVGKSKKEYALKPQSLASEGTELAVKNRKLELEPAESAGLTATSAKSGVISEDELRERLEIEPEEADTKDVRDDVHVQPALQESSELKDAELSDEEESLGDLSDLSLPDGNEHYVPSALQNEYRRNSKHTEEEKVNDAREKQEALSGPSEPAVLPDTAKSITEDISEDIPESVALEESEDNNELPVHDERDNMLLSNAEKASKPEDVLGAMSSVDKTKMDSKEVLLEDEREKDSNELLPKDETEIPAQKKEEVQRKPSVGVNGFLALLQAVGADVEVSFSPEALYRSPQCSSDMCEEIVRAAEVGTGLQSFDPNTVSMIVLEELPLLVSSSLAGCLIPDRVFSEGVSCPSEKELRPHVEISLIKLWKSLFSHLINLVANGVMKAEEVGDMFGPLLISQHSRHGKESQFLLRRILEAAISDVSGRSGSPSLAEDDLDLEPRLETEAPYKDDVSVASDGSSSTLGSTPPKVQPVKLSEEDRKPPPDPTVSYEDDFEDDVPLTETAAYLKMMSSAHSEPDDDISDILGNSGPQKQESEADDDVERELARSISPPVTSPRTRSPSHSKIGKAKPKLSLFDTGATTANDKADNKDLGDSWGGSSAKSVKSDLSDLESVVSPPLSPDGGFGYVPTALESKDQQTAGNKEDRDNEKSEPQSANDSKAKRKTDFWNNSDTESEVDLQLSTGGFDQDDDDDFDFYG